LDVVIGSDLALAFMGGIAFKHKSPTNPQMVSFQDKRRQTYPRLHMQKENRYADESEESFRAA